MSPRLRAWLGLWVGRTVEVSGLPIRVPAGVLDPALFRVGAWFAAEVGAEVRPGWRVLDLGCGSGVVGALAARAGAVVTAVDLDPRAVAAARTNGVADARQGDLFGPVAGERFDLVAFNPPYFPGVGWGRPYRAALYGGRGLAVVRRFAAAVGGHLAPGGRAWVAWSDRAPPAEHALGEGWRRARVEQLRDERLEIWERGP